MLNRIRPFLTLEAANRAYKAMVLPVLDYCDVVWHECGQGNNNDIERLQRRGSRIVYHKAGLGLSTDDILINLGWDSLHSRRESHVYNLVKSCIDQKASVYFDSYFKVRRCIVHNYNTRNSGNLVLDEVRLESTKLAFFYKRGRIFNWFNGNI